MKHVIVSLALLASASLYAQDEINRINTEIQGMSEKKGSCEDQAKMLQQQIAELTESIARAQSALEVKKVQQAAPVTTGSAETGSSDTNRIGNDIQGMTEKKISCEEQVKMLQQQIAELTEKIARAQSALEVKKVQQQTLPTSSAPTNQSTTPITA